MEKLVLLFLPFLLSGALSISEKAADPAFCNEAEKTVNTQEVTTYYFIRHAEKMTNDPNEKDPELTEQGLRRAENWAKVFKDVPFDLVFSTNYKRTRSTAQKVADSQQKEVELYDPAKLNDKIFQEKTEGKTVLVVGHSNTTPAFVNTILKEKKYHDIADSESGSLFIVTVHPDGTKTSQLLYIN